MSALMAKPIGEMSGPELRAFTEEASGVRRPPQGAPQADRDRWFVAFLFGACVRSGGSAEEAAAWAVSELVRRPDFARYRPYLEEALGRQLREDELALATGKSDPFDLEALTAAMARN